MARTSPKPDRIWLSQRQRKLHHRLTELYSLLRQQYADLQAFDRQLHEIFAEDQWTSEVIQRKSLLHSKMYELKIEIADLELQIRALYELLSKSDGTC
jgi:hypothetical protein